MKYFRFVSPLYQIYVIQALANSEIMAEPHLLELIWNGPTIKGAVTQLIVEMDEDIPTWKPLLFFVILKSDWLNQIIVKIAIYAHL